MDRYLGMGFHFDSQTGALTATMLHSVTKLLATACTDSLSPQPTPHTLDLFHPSTDTTPVDPKTYQQIVGMMIYLLKVRSDIHLPVIMAATHNAAPTQGDLTKLIRILAYLKATPDLGPTFHTRGGAILVAHCDAAFAVHTSTGGSHFSISLSIGEDSAPYHVISRAQTTKISLNPTHSEYSCASLTTELVKFDRTFCDWILLPQSEPTIIKTDSAPSIATALAPNFPRHSKNLLVEYHNVREATLSAPSMSSPKDSWRTSMLNPLAPLTLSRKDLSSSMSPPIPLSLSTSNYMLHYNIFHLTANCTVLSV